MMKERKKKKHKRKRGNQVKTTNVEQENVKEVENIEKEIKVIDEEKEKDALKG